HLAKVFGFLRILNNLQCSSQKISVRFDRFETIEGESETLFRYTAKLVGRERLINVTIVNAIDFDNTTKVLAKLSTFKNGDWVKHNIDILSKGCEFIKNYFMRYMSDVTEKSNLPDDLHNCPFKKGEYYIKDAKFTAKTWPTAIMPPGLYKATFDFMRDGKLVGGFIGIFDIIS
ncbi:hypothetical protein KR009_011334, partial [Drosophila setifemur]